MAERITYLVKLALFKCIVDERSEPEVELVINFSGRLLVFNGSFYLDVVVVVWTSVRLRFCSYGLVETAGFTLIQRAFDIFVDGGNTAYDSYEELFAKARYKTLSVAYYVETNDSDKHYFEASYGLPFITVVDVKVGYAEWYYGDNHASVTVSKDLGDYNLGIMVMDGARHGDPFDMAAVTFAYNF